jgi:hypothetical protein
MNKHALACLGLASFACGGGGSTSPTPLLSVGGDYSIEKTVTSDDCGGSTGVFTNPGSVRQAPGAASLVLNDHGTRDLPGTIAPDGAFQLAPYRGPAGGVDGIDTYDPGRFQVGGFAMRVTTRVLRTQGAPPAPDCTIVTNWAGTKQGPPNVIP